MGLERIANRTKDVVKVAVLGTCLSLPIWAINSCDNYLGAIKTRQYENLPCAAFRTREIKKIALEQQRKLYDKIRK